MPLSARRLPPVWVPPFIALAAIWGASFLFIKVADRALSPTEVALARVAVGAAVLLVVLAASGAKLPRRPRVWAHLAFVGLIGNVVPFSLFAYGETKISSVLAGIWNATTPLMTLLVVVVALREERPTRERTLGLALGFAGVVCLLGPWSGLGGGALRGDLACLGAAALYGVSWPYMRRFLTPLGLPGTTLAAGQLLCATVELAVIVPFVGHRPGTITVAVALSILGLGALGTGIAFVLSYRLIAMAGATTSSTVTYVVPLFATVLGIAVLGEGLTWNEPVGAAIVLAGVALSQRSAVRRAVAGTDAVAVVQPAVLRPRASVPSRERAGRADPR
jgi:drug/metabolite transporter (DMT)-like permease